jgi:hypothetical protein
MLAAMPELVTPHETYLPINSRYASDVLSSGDTTTAFERGSPFPKNFS